MAYLRQHANGRWSAQIYLGKNPETGKTRWETKAFDTRKAAVEWARKLETQRDEGAYRPTVSTATFADFLRKTWLPMYRRKARSAYSSEKTVEKWICRPQPETPYLGRIPLRKLSVSHFDALYLAMEEKHGIRPRGILHLHGLLRRALKFAMTKGQLPRNPTDAATVPKGKLGPARSLTHEQETRFIAAAKKDAWSALWHLLLDTGLRPGEACALKWEPDTAEVPRWGWIDLDAKLVRVRATLARAGVESAQGGWKLTPPKTENSIRDVPINDDTVTELRRWRKQQLEQRMQVGPEWQNHGFVFTTSVGSPLCGHTLSRAWTRVLMIADGGRGDLGAWGPEPKREPGKSGRLAKRSFTPRFSVYVLRHTMATLNYLDGMDLGLLSRRLGHSSYSFTFERYARGVKAEHTRAVSDNTQRRWRSASS
jgi:integrase